MRKQLRRGLIGWLTVGLLGVVSISPAGAAPEERSFPGVELAARAKAAAEASRGPSQEVDEKPVEPVPVADGELAPDDGGMVEASDPGVSAEFSGFEIEETLDLEIATLDDSVAESAESETAGTAVTEPVEVTATASDGDEVTEFPAEVETEDPEGDEGPEVVVDVDPGVALEIEVDQKAIGDLDEASLRIFTREEAGEPWLEVPSYYDAKTGSVKGELDHLSQFVVIGTPYVPPPGPRVVLDPDDDLAWATWNGATITEGPLNIQLAQNVKQRLEDRCLGEVILTRGPGGPAFLSQATRAGIAAAHNPDLTITLAFDALTGGPWGVSSDGGTKAYSRGNGNDNAVQARLVAEMPGYTTRPANATGSGLLPYAAFNGLPGAVAHLETLYLDHNFDKPVIDNGGPAIADGVFTSIGKYLETKGFNCQSPARDGWPKRPSAAELNRWRHLGRQNYQAYGADPVNFATGNLFEEETIFNLSGLGDQETDLTLMYNSQDGRDSRVGVGWSFGLGSRAQRFDDGSVLIVRDDGASYIFEPNAGGYETGDGTFGSLKDLAGGRLELKSTDGETWIYDAGDINGIGELITHTDRQGNASTISYGTPDGDDKFVPLASTVDAAGQTVSFGKDAAGRVSTITHPDGREWTLSYDGAGNLVKITEPDSRTRTFTYDAAHRMLTATDAKGVQYLRNEYDGQGRVVKQWDAEANLRTLEYLSGEVRYTDNEGNITTYRHDSKARITEIVDAAGGSEKFTYNDDSMVTSNTDELGRTFKYSYDSNGNLTKEIAPDGSVTEFTYTPTGEVASVTDQGGPDGDPRVTQLSVNSKGLTESVTRPDGAVASSTFDAHGNLASTTDPNGGVTTYVYDDRGNPVSATDPAGGVTKFEYDAANRPITVTDPAGGVTTLAWDTADRLVRQTDAVGGVTSLEYDANDHIVARIEPDGAKTTFVWDDLFRVVEMTEPDGATTKYVHNREDEVTQIIDPLGHTTSFRLDELYRPTAVTDPLGNEWKRVYDKASNLIKTTDPRGHSTSYAYDELDRQIELTDPTGATWKSAYDPVGRLVEETDPNGQTATYEWDSVDRLIKTTDEAGEETRSTYDRNGNQTGFTDRRGHTWKSSFDALDRTTKEVAPDGGATSITYDPIGNPIKVTDPLDRTTSFGYDAVGRLLTETDPLGNTTRTDYDPLGRPTTITDANGHTNTTVYDPAGQPLTVTDGNGHTTSYEWDPAGRQTAMVDPNGIKTVYGYDAAGQLTAVTEGAEAGVEPDSDSNVTTRYSWNPTGQLASITNALGITTASFEHDPNGQVSKETNALGSVWTYSYDKLGRLRTERDANGQATNYGYTKRSDLAKRTYSTGETTSFGYDAEQNLISMTDPLGGTAWEYDTNGRQITQNDALGKTLRYRYNTADDLTKLVMPEGDTIGYAYDKAGRPQKQTSPWGNIDYGWDPADNLAMMGRTNGINTAFGYDPADRLTNITHQTPDTAGGPAALKQAHTDVAGSKEGCLTAADYLARRTVPEAGPAIDQGKALSLNYAYDPANNVTERSRTNGDQTETRNYTYDHLNRLTGSETSTGVTNAYAYDPTGNRTAWITNDAPDTAAVGDALTMTAEYNDMGQLTGTHRERPGNMSSQVDYLYDRNGNRTRQTVERLGGQGGSNVTRYTYRPNDQPETIEQPGRKTSFEYDGLGRALTTTNTTPAGEQTTTAAFNGLDPVSLTNNTHGTNTIVRDTLGEVALQATPGDTDSQWALLDMLGSTVAQTTSDGTITALAEYSDWGVQAFDTDNWDSETNFTGEQSDPGHGADLFMARNYDPMTATWSGQDKWRGLIQQPQTLSRFNYVTNNPIDTGDAYGNWGVPKWAKKAWNKTKSVAKKVVRKVKSVAKKAVDSFKNIWRGITSKSTNIYQNVKKNVKQQYNNAKNGVKRAGNAIANSPVGTTIARHIEYTKSAVKATVKWVSNPENLRKIATVAVGVAAFAGAIACGATVVCAVAVGVAAGAATYTAKNVGTDNFSLKGLGTSALVGGGSALLGAGAGKLASKVGGKVISRVTSKLGSKVDDVVGSADDIGKTCLANSFTPETRVVMANGTTEPISEVEVGDYVLATDPTTGESSGRLVEATIQGNGQKELVDVTVSAGGQRETFTATDGHPFWDLGDRQWVDAGDLEAGDLLRDDEGSSVQVVDVDEYSGRATVHNLSISGVHTFYVEADGVAALTHNCGGSTALEAADEALAAGKTSGAASALKTKSGTYIGVSSENAATNVQVQAAVKNAPQTKWAGHCAEMQCLSKALDDGVDVGGGTIDTVNVGSQYRPHGVPRPPCATCKAVLDKFGVGY